MAFVFRLPASAGNANVNAGPAADPTKTRMILELKHSSPLFSCRIDPTGRFVFAGAQDHTIQRWEIATQKRTSLEGHKSWIRGLTFHAGSKQLLSGDYTGKVLFWPWEAETPRPERTLEAHRGWVRAVAISPDGNTFATCGNDLLVKLWNFADGRLLKTFQGHEWHVYNLAFHPSGRFLASGDLHGVVKHWDIETGQAARTLDASILYKYDPTFRADIGGVRSMAFSPDGSLLACSGITNVTNAFAGIGNPAIVLFNWETGRTQQVLRPAAAFQGTLWGLGFHPQGFIAGAAGGSGGGLWFWRPSSSPSFHFLSLPANARDLSLHPDGRRLAIPFFDGAVRIYQMG